MKLYAGNLPNDMSEDELTSAFKVYGEIQSLKIITDRESGRSRGFGFIEMSDNDAQNAIKGLNETDMQGRQITVNQAQDRPQNTKRSY